MIDPIQAFMQANALTAPAFQPDSRYFGLEIAQWRGLDGQSVAYVRRRFVPAPERFATQGEHTISQGDRLDNLAARYLGDPRQFWRLCDANGVARPDELVETVGAKLRLTLPEGVPGGSDA
jgi:nucleoid-associated protein YgaU